MDIFIRILIMIGVSVALPLIANIIYEPFRDKKSFKELNIIEKIGMCILYFILNWFIIVPSILFFECFKYVFIK